MIRPSFLIQVLNELSKNNVTDSVAIFYDSEAASALQLTLNNGKLISVLSVEMTANEFEERFSAIANIVKKNLN